MDTIADCDIDAILNVTSMRIGDIDVGDGGPLALISGLNVIESFEGTLQCALGVQGVAERHGLPVVFKASFDKANRSSRHSYRGAGLDEGLRILERVKTETGMPVITDVHEPGQAKIAAEVVDCLQIPAFLCRQTDLIAASAATGLPMNIKKGQFMAPRDLVHSVEKARSFGAPGVLVTERGTSFGYNNLVVDMRGLAVMRDFAPVVFDGTHSVQLPGGQGGSSGGQREHIPVLARAAVAAGVSGLFMETHPKPEEALCDGPNSLPLARIGELLETLVALDRVVKSAPLLEQTLA